MSLSNALGNLTLVVSLPTYLALDHSKSALYMVMNRMLPFSTLFYDSKHRHGKWDGWNRDMEVIV
jgi:hypothetical protein